MERGNRYETYDGEKKREMLGGIAPVPENGKKKGNWIGKESKDSRKS